MSTETTDHPDADAKPKGKNPKAAKADEPKRILVVRATRDGTYPRKGEAYAIYRKEGEVFELNDPAHFSDAWMEDAAQSEAEAVPAPARPIPLTTSRVRPGQNPFASPG